MDNRTVIGSRINSALAFSNKKQKELAAHLGVPDNTISYFCSGKRVPNAEQIIEIAKYLNVSADYLLGLTDNKTIDITVKAICKYTGLSDEAVESLADFIDLNHLEGYGLCPEDYDLDQLDVEAVESVAKILHIDYFGDPVQTLKEIEEFGLKDEQKAIEVRNNFIASDWFWDIVGFISRLNILSERWEETFINEIRAKIKGDSSNEDLFRDKAVELSRECDFIRYLITQKINEYINFYDNRIAEENKRILTGGYSRETQLEEKILKEAAENGEHNPPKE